MSSTPPPTASPTTPSTKEHVKAFARIRPSSSGAPKNTLSSSQLTTQCGCWIVDPAERALYLNLDEKSQSKTSATSTSSSGEVHRFNDVFLPTHDNKYVYQGVVQPIVQDVLNGKNGCVMCYGQTESGKTHTIFGYNDPGVVPRALKEMFSEITSSAARKTTRSRIAISYLEIYNETVNDLLEPKGTKLPVREINGVAYVEKLSVRVCDSLETTLQLLQYGSENKTVGNSYLHDKSSRAHTIFCVQVARERKNKNVITTVLSQMNFVDLAGSEILSDRANQSETKAINLSLFSLQNVISSLANKEDYIPYRNAILTRLLAPSLSVNSVTAVLCTVNAMPEHLSFTQGTLRFGNVSRMIEQKAILNEIIREGANKIKLKETIEEETLSMEDASKKKKGEEAEEEIEKANVNTVMVDTRWGKVHCWHGSSSKSNKQNLALCLHAFGNGCSGEDWLPVFDVLCAQGYTILSPDFPGFGKTGVFAADRQTSRTERLDEQGGPLEIVYDLMDFLSGRDRKKKILVIGWDWGGNMALALSLGAFKNRVSGLALYHPSWTDKHDLLYNISVPVLLCWEPSDQLHLFATGKKMAKLIKKSKLVSLVFKEKNWRAADGGTEKHWKMLWDVLVSQISSWVKKTLAVVAPPKKQPVKGTTSPPPVQATATTTVTQTIEGEESSTDEDMEYESDEDEDSFSTQSSFLACLLSDPATAATVIAAAGITKRRKPTKTKGAETSLSFGLENVASPHPAEEEKWSVSNLGAIYKKEDLKRLLQDALLGRNNATCMKPEAMKLIGHLPVILPFSTSSVFISTGLWPQASSTELDLPCIKYPLNRQVFVKVKGICSNLTQSSQFGTISEKQLQQSKTYLTYRARIASKTTPTQCSVSIPTTDNTNKKVVEVPWEEVLDWNEATKFPPAAGKCTLQFEDAIIGRYSDTITRMKICECALAIQALVPKLNFVAAEKERASVPSSGGQSFSDIATLEELFPCNHELLQLQKTCVGKIRKCMDMIHHVQMGKDPNRFCVADVGRLSTHGQWHCHGMASVFAAILLPFASVLHFDIRYRDGFCCDSDTRDVYGKNWDGEPRNIADHTWLEITFFPSGISFVTDPSFHGLGEDICVPLEVAYSMRPGNIPRFPVRNLTNRVKVPANQVLSSPHLL